MLRGNIAHQHLMRFRCFGLLRIVFAIVLLPYFSLLQAAAANEHNWQDHGRCGTNCLYLIASIEREIDYKSVAELVPVSNQGSSLAQLQDAAEQLGLGLEVLEVQPDELSDLKVPFILHVNLSEDGGIGHFFTVLEIDDGVDREFATIIDGGTGELKKVLLPQLILNYSGFVLAKSQTQTTGLSRVLPLVAIFSLGMLAAWGATQLFWSKDSNEVSNDN